MSLSKKQSAGILVFRRKSKLEFFLVHPGGLFWAKKDDGVWSIPKGEYIEEDPLTAAKREFQEETGFSLEGKCLPLQPVVQKSGKRVMAWAVEGDFDACALKSNLFEMEWPPKSGRMASFPEVDRADWFDFETARVKINEAQRAFLEQVVSLAMKD